jgi:hypothetical protein
VALARAGAVRARGVKVSVSYFFHASSSSIVGRVRLADIDGDQVGGADLDEGGQLFGRLDGQRAATDDAERMANAMREKVKV